MTADKIRTGDHVLITARWQKVTKVEHYTDGHVRVHVEGRAEPFELPPDYPVDIDHGDGDGMKGLT
jgi:hypothetical protein